MTGVLHTNDVKTKMHYQENDVAKFNAILHRANCQTYNFVCRAKQDNYNVSMECNRRIWN